MRTANSSKFEHWLTTYLPHELILRPLKGIQFVLRKQL